MKRRESLDGLRRRCYIRGSPDVSLAELHACSARQRGQRMRRITVVCVVAVMVAGLFLSSQSPAQGQSVPSPTAASVPTPDVGDILSRSLTAEAALTSVHTDRSFEDGNLSLRAVGDCVNRPHAVLARLRLTGTEPEALLDTLRHIDVEFGARMVKGQPGWFDARARLPIPV
jgi:hypothetical protein